LTSPNYSEAIEILKTLWQQTHELRLIISRHIREDEWTLDAIMKVTEVEITARERALGNLCHGPRKTIKDPLTASSLLTSGSGTPKCCCCFQSHASSSCRTVTDASERKQILRTGRCFVCLRKNHMNRECRSAVKCNKCNGRYHVSICSRGQGKPPQSSGTMQPTRLQYSKHQTHPVTLFPQSQLH